MCKCIAINNTSLYVKSIIIPPINRFVLEDFYFIFLNGWNAAMWRSQEVCHVLSTHQEAALLGGSSCPCWLSLCVLFVIFKANCNRVVWSGCLGISTFVTLATLREVCAPECLFTEHSAAWCVDSGNDLLFIYVNKPKHLLRNRKIFHSICFTAVYSGNTPGLVFKLYASGIFCLLWTELLATLKRLNRNLLFMHQIFALLFIRSIFLL